MDKKYDIKKIKQALQDEYMAAMLVGFTEDTPDVMDIEFSNTRELVEMAERYGLDLDEFILEEDEEPDQELMNSKYR